MFHSQYYLVAKVNHIQSPRFPIYIYIYINKFSLQCKDAGWEIETEKLGQQRMQRTTLGPRAIDSTALFYHICAAVRKC
jgi:hypothetical protein